MSKELYEKELIYDEECKNDVFYTVLAKYEYMSEELEEIKLYKRAYRKGERVEGAALKKLVHDLEVSLSVLKDCMKDAEKYKIIT